MYQYCRHIPWPQQRAFLQLSDLEAFYGGAAGGGKSDALLMAALEYVHVPGYSALILRRDFARLRLPGAIMDRAKQWLWSTDARWNGGEARFTFPSGATLQFGYLDNPDDWLRYQSSEYQFIGFDELTEFQLTTDIESNPYLKMFARLRKTIDIPVPLRMRSASNPGNVGHAWVKERFLTEESSKAIVRGDRGEGGVFNGPEGRKFVPAAIRDNPALDPEEYIKNLQHLPPVTRARLMLGDWQVMESRVIQPEWMRRYDAVGDMLKVGDGRVIDRRACRRFATIDTAGTSRDKEDQHKGRMPSWSVVGIWDYWAAQDLLFLRHIWRGQVEWFELKVRVQETLRDWQCSVVRIENAHCGPALRDEVRGFGDVRLTGPVLPGMNEPQRGAKVDRAIASGLLNRMEGGKFLIPQDAAWLPAYVRELTDWGGLPDEVADQIDVSSYAAWECKQNGGTWSGFIGGGGLKR